MNVVQIPAKDAEPWLLNKHYARRLCPISYAYGIFDGPKMIGIVTYGTPVSSSLREGVCGKDFEHLVLELNRLCCENEKNIASILVGRSLRLLPKPKIVVSYADSAQGHVGYVYQATNFVYTGLSAKRTDWRVKGKEHLHGATIADETRGMKNRAQYMREKYGDDFYLQDRPRKHRYIYFVANKKDKKILTQALRYPIMPYPKGETKRYDASAKVITQELLFV